MLARQILMYRANTTNPDKKMKHIMTRHALLYVAVMAFVLSCSDKDSFQPGPAANGNGYDVYFSNSNETRFLYEESPVKDSIVIEIVRTGCSSALDIPILFEGDPEIIVPGSVHFDAQQDTASLVMRCPDIKMSAAANYKLTIPSDYSNPYTIKDGSTWISGTVLWSSWEVLADTVLIISSYDKHPRQGCKLEYFVGDNRFRFTDFLGSGNPLVFKLGSDVNFKDLRKNSGKMIPYARYYYENSNVWDWANDGDWTPWTPVGGTIEIAYPSFGWGHVYYESYGGYDNIDFNVSKPDTIKLAGNKYIYDAEYYDKSVQMLYVYSTTKANGYWEYLYFLIGYLIDPED